MGKPHACGSASRKRALVLAVSLGALGLHGCTRSASTTTSGATEAPTAIGGTVTIAPTVTKTPSVATPPVVPHNSTTKPVPVAATTVVPTAVVTATPSALKRPQIISVTATPAVVHAGGTVAWLVLTTDDVISVVAHVTAYTLPMHRVGPGRFALNFTIPANVPGFFHGRYDLTVHAQSGSGESTERPISLTFE